MRLNAGTSLDIYQVDRTPTAAKQYPDIKIFPIGKMPIIDAHFHLQSSTNPKDQTSDAITKYLAIMDECGIDVAINLSGHQALIENIDQYHEQAQGRILHCPGTYFLGDTKRFWWTNELMNGFKHPGIAGLKQWFKYRQALKEDHIRSSYNHQATLGIPSVGMHIADPPQRGFWQENFWKCIADAEQTIREHPQIDFIMAHGFWLMNTDECLEVLGRYFDCYPNLHVDLSAVFSWWDNPDISYHTLRAFIIKYKERILYGTDGNPNYTNKERITRTFHILESNQQYIPGFFSNPDETNYIHGLELPLDVLNHIYWANALRIIPQLKIGLKTQGFDF